MLHIAITVFWCIFVIAVAVVAVYVKFVWPQGGKAANPRLRGYGVVIDGNVVKSHGKTLGPLAGARAEVTGGTRSRRHTRAAVIITTATGSFHQQNIQGPAVLRAAQAWAVHFNTIAATAKTFPAPAAADAAAIIAARLAGEAAGAAYAKKIRAAANYRVSDADRDRALARLNEAFQIGQIAIDEFDQRSGQILAARTRSELAAPIADLPPTPAPTEGKSSS